MDRRLSIAPSRPCHRGEDNEVGKVVLDRPNATASSVVFGCWMSSWMTANSSPQRGATATKPGGGGPIFSRRHQVQ